MTASAPTRPGTLFTELPQPSGSYKRRVWLAVGGLVVFLTLYFVLAGWFLYTAYRLTIGADSIELAGLLVGGCAVFLAVVMLKPVFFVKRGDTQGTIEVTETEQPRLFAFLHELADTAAAPRPHRVFLSPRVNAAVFYDLSALNLVFPSKKNLEIGLALVNALSLGELRAVLAHEFGHFTQRSMAVMRWGYLAQQIAAHLVTRRDKLDELLVQLSHVDVRIAWLGWVLSLIVWSIRSLVDSAFGIVVLLQRALSREMEMQADLVAVSLTGSDALVHALHRLQAADDSWDRTLSLVGDQHANGRVPRDIFPLHARIVERMGDILSDPEYGRVPAVPPSNPAEHRLFKPELAQPPRMWLTHPLNHEREANAKRRYVRAPIDDRSAWTLFDDAATLRERLTAVMLEAEGKEVVAVDEALKAVDAQFGREYLDRRYLGAYLGRSVTRATARYDELLSQPPSDWRTRLETLYPESLIDDIARLRTLEKELDQLRAIRSGVLKPADGGIRHRGRIIKPRDLPKTIEQVERVASAIERRLAERDKVCRSVHLGASMQLGNGWPDYLRGTLALLHYADHTAANLRDLQGLLGHTVHLATVTRRVSAAWRKRIVDCANELHRAISAVHRQKNEVTLDTALAERVGVTAFGEMLSDFDLPEAAEENLGEWLNVIDSWVDQAAGACSAVRSAALEQLLLTERAVSTHVREGTVPGPAPAPSRAPASYDVLLTGKERERKRTLNWLQRVQIADGPVAAVARVTAAAAIIVAVLGFGRFVGTATITVYNGLATAVTVRIDSTEFAVPAFGTHAQEVDGSAVYRIESRARGKVLESFDAEIPGSFARFVYNVAGAAPLIEWTAVYGTAKPRPERVLGAPRWTRTSATVLFGRPPESVSSSSGGSTILVLSGLGDQLPNYQLSALATAADRQRAVAAHARWDATNSANVMTWLAFAQQLVPDYQGLLQQRVAESPNDVLLLRLEQDGATGATKDTVCARHRARAETAPENADLQYLAARCITNRQAQVQAFRDGHRRWPENGWFAYAAGGTFAEYGEWQRSLEAWEVARGRLRAFAAHVAMDMGRVHRLIDPDSGAAAMRALTRMSRELQYLDTLEKGAGLEPPYTTFASLARGDLDGALTQAKGDSTLEPRIIRMAAASDGASPELWSRALALPIDAGLDEDTRWESIALAMRLGRDHTSLLPPAASGRRDDVDGMLRFVELARDAKTLGRAEAALDGLSPWMRGHAYSAGLVLLGAKAPAKWRTAARRLLFASERPYFQE